MTDAALYLALGSNLGDRAENLAEARRRLSEQVSIVRASHVYETPPWGITDQPAFYNQVLETCTSMTPLSLLHLVKQIEVEMGRIASVRYGPRLIDIDLLVYGQTVLHSETLTLPHPRLFERAFVLVPFAEIAPDLIPPTQAQTIAELCAALDVNGIRQLEGEHA